MKKQFYTTLILLFTTHLISAQVQMYYPDHNLGEATIDHISNVIITSFVPATIEFIYKAKVINEQGEIVMELTTDVVAHEEGINDYRENPFIGLRILKNDVDLSRYTGKLRYISEIVHPQDTSSIIASEEKEVFLKDGVYVNKEGTVITDSRLIKFELKLGHVGDFNLDDIYEKLVFRNGNPIACPIDFQFEISQGGDIIYKSSCMGLLIPAGESRLTREQQKEFAILMNDYEKRNKKEKIRIQYGIENNSKRSASISLIRHGHLGAEYTSYTNKSIGLSFDFIEYPNYYFHYLPSDAVIVFDENGQVEEISRDPTGSLKLNANSPFGSSFRRDDVNGAIDISVLDKNNFSPKQLKSYLAYISKCKGDDLIEINSMGLSILATSRMINRQVNGNFTREITSSTICINDGARLIIFYVKFTSNYDEFPYRVPVVKTIDIDRILNSLMFNGVKFNFDFDEDGKLLDLKLANNGKQKNIVERNKQYEKYLRYHWLMTNQSEFFSSGKALDSEKEINYTFLDSVILARNIINKSDVQKFRIITPEQDGVRTFQEFRWDSVGINFTHRVDQSTYFPMAQKRKEVYFHINTDSIVFKSEMMVGVTMNDGQDPETKTEILATKISFLPVQTQRISVSRLETDETDGTIFRSIVAYENSSRRQKAPKIRIVENDGWKFYVPEKKLNAGRKAKRNNCFIVKTNDHLYRFQIYGGFKSDILLFLNSIEIEGKKLKFEYDEDESLKSIEVLKI